VSVEVSRQPAFSLRVSAVGLPASRVALSKKYFLEKRSQTLPVFIEDREKNEPKSNPNKAGFSPLESQFKPNFTPPP
jgi:hypothetical protein